MAFLFYYGGTISLEAKCFIMPCGYVCVLCLVNLLILELERSKPLTSNLLLMAYASKNLTKAWLWSLELWLWTQKEQECKLQIQENEHRIIGEKKIDSHQLRNSLFSSASTQAAADALFLAHFNSKSNEQLFLDNLSLSSFLYRKFCESLPLCESRSQIFDHYIKDT